MAVKHYAGRILNFQKKGVGAERYYKVARVDKFGSKLPPAYEGYATKQVFLAGDIVNIDMERDKRWKITPRAGRLQVIAPAPAPAVIELQPDYSHCQEADYYPDGVPDGKIIDPDWVESVAPEGPTYVGFCPVDPNFPPLVYDPEAPDGEYEYEDVEYEDPNTGETVVGTIKVYVVTYTCGWHVSGPTVFWDSGAEQWVPSGSYGSDGYIHAGTHVNGTPSDGAGSTGTHVWLKFPGTGDTSTVASVSQVTSTYKVRSTYTSAGVLLSQEEHQSCPLPPQTWPIAFIAPITYG